MNFATKII